MLVIVNADMSCSCGISIHGRHNDSHFYIPLPSPILFAQGHFLWPSRNRIQCITSLLRYLTRRFSFAFARCLPPRLPLAITCVPFILIMNISVLLPEALFILRGWLCRHFGVPLFGTSPLT